jgi:hypothetical protein
LNIYVVVEGDVGEKQVYETWIPHVNPNLSCVDHIWEIKWDQFAVFSGHGYPQYFGVIDNAIEDINSYGNIDRFVIAIDSEEMARHEKYQEIDDHIDGKRCKADIVIVVQHFCLETWALGNRRIITKNVRNPTLRKYLQFFNVRHRDPELLPDYPVEELNRAQFAEKYLRRALNQKHKNVTYRKGRPQVLLHPSYYREVKERFEDTSHIASFGSFLDAFR